MTKALPPPYNSNFHWVKGDMLATVSFKRLFLPFHKKKYGGERDYVKYIITDQEMAEVRKCILNGLGMNFLTKHLP